ncbi:ribosomal RNA large subunit methyltransferase H [Andreesenia angusta]|uniref:Ribosomal RNA large subunit methyltransferase H n=1 Tax=Andreesenia angusta TaxID=39480 RepID=A0A1S1V4X7_9FIRM|nr:23S rRNA (pseudouridine(1915)-N(3))-methyltransferase RlmH [Andreesenia angusta]OHW61642.1 ribosomal RNA large subunit methyltransferase H [Andreesenia angusta]
MKIKLITVGKLKEDYLRKGVDYYIKQLKKSYEVEVIELLDEKTPDTRSSKQEERIKSLEGERILSKVAPEDYVITLEIDGKKLDSEGFRSLMTSSLGDKKSVAFVIGGSLGISREVSKRSDYKLSFSDMTFPHQLMKLILLEQLSKARA